MEAAIRRQKAKERMEKHQQDKYKEIEKVNKVKEDLFSKIKV